MNVFRQILIFIVIGVISVTLSDQLYAQSSTDNSKIVAAVKAVELGLCPITSKLSSAARQQSTEGEAPFGPSDALFLSLAEVNGFLSADPKLTFETGSARLRGPQMACLRDAAYLYARAIKAANVPRSKRNTVAMRIVGHADATGVSEANYQLSFQRASSAAEAFAQAAEHDLGWRPQVLAEGHGGSDTWWCGIEGAGAEKCAIWPAALGVTEDKNILQRNDRRLELQFTGTSIAGPRLDLLALELSASLANQADFRRLLKFEPRMRYYPAGTGALRPLQVAVGESEKVASTDGCMNGSGGWPETDWHRVGKISPPSALEAANAEDPPRFDETNLLARLRAVPVVLRSQGRPSRVRVVLELATGTIGPVTLSHQAAPTAAAGALAPAAAAGGTMAAQTTTRRSLGLGVPEYWRMRLRLRSLLKEVVGDGQGTDAWRAIKGCLPQIATASGWQDETAEQFGNWAYAAALSSLPRDFDGLMAQANDFNRRARMFGLSAGLKLQVQSGQLMLPRNSGQPTRYDMEMVGGGQTYDLFAAPLTTTDPDYPGWIYPSGPYGQLAVTLNPTTQGVWWLTSNEEDGSELPQPGKTDPATKDKWPANLANPYALERFLRGRVVRVFLPGPPPNEKEKVDMKEFNVGEDTVSSKRDVMLVAAATPGLLEAFALAYGPAQLLADAKRDDAICPARTKQLHVLCGFMSQNVALSLLLPASVNGENRNFPIDTRIGSLMPPDLMKACFHADTPAAFGASVEDRLDSTVVIERLGPSGEPPALYDPRDCRLLGWPILAGGSVKW